MILMKPIFDVGGCPSGGGFWYGDEASTIDSFSVDLNPCLVFAARFIEDNPGYTSCIPIGQFHISRIDWLSRLSEVPDSVIRPVMIYMVQLAFRVFAVKHFPNDAVRPVSYPGYTDERVPTRHVEVSRGLSCKPGVNRSGYARINKMGKRANAPNQNAVGEIWQKAFVEIAKIWKYIEFHGHRTASPVRVLGRQNGSNVLSSAIIEASNLEASGG